MATKIVVPQMGESVVEATIGEWLVQVGPEMAWVKSRTRTPCNGLMNLPVPRF